jgi:hypothetical protein
MSRELLFILFRSYQVHGTYPEKEAVMKTKYGVCPTCNRSGEFTLLGEQVWPAAVAKKLNLPARIALWQCPNCLTTVSDPDLLPAPPARTGGKTRIAS